MAKKKQTRHERDIASLNEEPTEYTDGSVAVHLPFDSGAYLRVFTVTEDDEPVGEHTYSSSVVAHVIEVRPFLIGLNVYVRLENKDDEGVRVMRVVVGSEEDGFETLGTWEKQT